MQKALFGAGCFWCVEDAFLKVDGVLDAVSGYSGGHTDHPTYEQVCTGRTGHAEVVEVSYDPEKVSFEQLLQVFFKVHDPTQLNRQGPDVGTQYRSAIFFTTPEQEETARKYVDSLTSSQVYPAPVVTQVQAAGTFYRAEEYHQRYYQKKAKSGILGWF